MLRKQYTVGSKELADFLKQPYLTPKLRKQVKDVVKELDVKFNGKIPNLRMAFNMLETDPKRVMILYMDNKKRRGKQIDVFEDAKQMKQFYKQREFLFEKEELDD